MYGLLDPFEGSREELASNCKVIREFKETVAPHLIENFELVSLHSAHSMLMRSLLDPQFKCINIMRKAKLERIDGDVHKLRE